MKYIFVYIYIYICIYIIYVYMYIYIYIIFIYIYTNIQVGLDANTYKIQSDDYQSVQGVANVLLMCC